MGVLAFVKRHMSSWSESNFDEYARLRNNLILFSFTITCVFSAFNARAAYVTGGMPAASTLLLNGLFLLLFLWQFFAEKYNAFVAWFFGALSLGMLVFFIVTDRADGTNHLWLYVLPIVGTLVVRLPYTLIYNFTLVALLVVLFYSPAYEEAQLRYSEEFRRIYPLTMLFVVVCNYAAVFAQHRTYRALLAISETFRNSSYTDPLTGTYNRRAMRSQLGGLEEDGQGLSFAMLDLDRFKVVNDTYGHEIGDRALRHVVNIVKERIPPSALLYRWGGEEFLLVLKSSHVKALAETLEHIRCDIEQTPLQLTGEGNASLTITVSIGAFCPQEAVTLGKCVAIADQRLYAAKQAGRNRVMM